ncbi:hypothetical protein GYMLUDRAFT_843423 [Collybiopsis luxurians FD-317 M1]|uniref:DNA (cytosine-5-)-methyltransferase n=1 Tax=Collybiopsis luxurians FD-317 M1 TaxID=944289 RepID=A0A0D0AXM8_9AGAR|nr:hypothetical protein GYMLUDRAFT_843423 [Collybiopsis luxurians FD-317 M1]
MLLDLFRTVLCRSKKARTHSTLQNPIGGRTGFITILRGINPSLILRTRSKFSLISLRRVSRFYLVKTRLMSYPDSFVFQGKLKDQYKLVGSSVPPALAQACGEKIKERLFTQWPDLRPTPTS